MTKEKATKKTLLSPESKPVSEETEQLLRTIHEALLERKAENIVQLDVRELTTLTDFFIVCNGTADVHVKAIADNISQKTKYDLGEMVWKKEGLDTRRWVILDYVNVVVHIFNEELRSFYNLEKMWNDAIRTQISD